MNNWFDPHTGILRFDELVSQRETFKKIMEDQFVSSEELQEQSQLVVEKLHQLEDALSPEMRVLVADTIAELAVLFTASHYSTIQEIKKSRGDK